MFYEEKESRVVFSNIAGKLSKCIRFRTLKDGVKVPYMVIKSGNVGKMFGNCLTDIKEFKDFKKLEQYSLSKEAIWIDEGFDQEEKYYEVMECVNEYEKKNESGFPINVFCRGHLPIESITVAPTYDRERKTEQIKRFCMSKYWLRNVDVRPSEIPYIRPAL